MHTISDIISMNVVDQNNILEIACSITPINNMTSEVPSNLPSI